MAERRWRPSATSDLDGAQAEAAGGVADPSGPSGGGGRWRRRGPRRPWPRPGPWPCRRGRRPCRGCARRGGRRPRRPPPGWPGPGGWPGPRPRPASRARSPTPRTSRAPGTSRPGLDLDCRPDAGQFGGQGLRRGPQRVGAQRDGRGLVGRGQDGVGVVAEVAPEQRRRSSGDGRCGPPRRRDRRPSGQGQAGPSVGDPAEDGVGVGRRPADRHRARPAGQGADGGADGGVGRGPAEELVGAEAQRGPDGRVEFGQRAVRGGARRWSTWPWCAQGAVDEVGDEVPGRGSSRPEARSSPGRTRFEYAAVLDPDERLDGQRPGGVPGGGQCGASGPSVPVKRRGGRRGSRRPRRRRAWPPCPRAAPRRGRGRRRRWRPGRGRPGRRGSAPVGGGGRFGLGPEELEAGALGGGPGSGLGVAGHDQAGQLGGGAGPVDGELLDARACRRRSPRPPGASGVRLGDRVDLDQEQLGAEVGQAARAARRRCRRA